MDLYDELPTSSLLYENEFAILLEASKQYNVSLVEFLTLNAKDLSRILKRSINEIAKFQQILLKELDKRFLEYNQPISILHKNKPEPFTTADIEIDELLGGGVFTNGITEVFGESSTGKSQFLMQLSLSVQLPREAGGLGGKSVYITTEGDLSTQRIEEMVLTRPVFVKHNVSQKNIFTVSCNDLMTQEHIVNVQLPVLLEQNNGEIKLVIIDSISHHMRVELQSNSFRESHENRHYIDDMAEKLNLLSKKYSVAIVVTNQVGDKPLPKLSEPTHQEIMDYDYQLGWLVGWKGSSILYRQLYNEPKALNANFSNENIILSDDEDYMLIDKEMQKLRQDRVNKHSNTKDMNCLIDRNQQNGTKSRSFISPVVKRKIDSRIPNLGLSWANHISTRILLRKMYKASPLVKRGEAHLCKSTDSAAFWQVKRVIVVVFSANSPSDEVPYKITRNGIESTL